MAKRSGAKEKEKKQGQKFSAERRRERREAFAGRIREAAWNILTYITLKLGRGYAAANLSFCATFHPRASPRWQIAGSPLRRRYVVPSRDLTCFREAPTIPDDMFVYPADYGSYRMVRDGTRMIFGPGVSYQQQNVFARHCICYSIHVPINWVQVQ